MTYQERALEFPCGDERLVGIVAQPVQGAGEPPATQDLGVVVIVGGPQYRVGSHRQFLLLSRALAAAGFATLRFDVRGMGDSRGGLHSFEQITPDIGAAVDALQQAVPQVRRIVLWGLCDAASAALLYCDARRDPRIRGLCLLNPWVRSLQSQARTQVRHYYADRLRQKQFWLKLLSGKVALSAMAGLWRSLRLAFAGSAPDAAGHGTADSFQHRMARAWLGFGGRMLLVLSGKDYTAREFLAYAAGDTAWSGWDKLATVQRHDLDLADHTFSDAASRAEVERLTLDWLRRLP